MAGFKPAKAQQAFLKLGIYGPCGSGKTFTSLLIAEGLAKRAKKKIAYVDTERGTDFYSQEVRDRLVHPAAFDFDALYTKSITEILNAVASLDVNEYGVVIIDSMTHVWEAAKNSYEGKLTKIGTIPITAWGKIKKPYKKLMDYLLSSNIHIIICARQGNDFVEDEDTGEMKTVGYKMKAEGETGYEPHILVRLEACKLKDRECANVAHVEKDRTGLLSGKEIYNPNFDSIALPILPLLGDKQAHIESEDEVAAKDAETLTAEDVAKTKKSAELLENLSAKMKICTSKAELAELSKSITAAVKAQMTTADVAALKEAYLREVDKYKS